MEITYDPEADAMYIKFQEGEFARNKVIDNSLAIEDFREKWSVLRKNLNFGYQTLDAQLNGVSSSYTWKGRSY